MFDRVLTQPRPISSISTTLGFVSPTGSRCARLLQGNRVPGSTMATDRNDWLPTMLENRRMATACIVSPNGSDRVDIFSVRDLPQQLRQDGAIALSARGELDRANIAGDRVHCQVGLATFAPASRVVLTCQPFAVTTETYALHHGPRTSGASLAHSGEAGDRTGPSTCGGSGWCCQRKSRDGHACRFSSRTRSSSDRTRLTANRTVSAKRYSQTNSS